MLKIFGGDLSSPSNKVRMVANYLGLEYEYQRIKVREGENRQDWFKKLNPVSKIPVLDDNGFALFESWAMCKYLCEKKKSSLYPAEIKARAIVEQWTDFVVLHVSASISKVLYNRIFYKFTGATVDERSLEDGVSFLARFLPIIDEQLGKSKYLAGDTLTLADITLLSSLDPCEICNIDLSPYKNILKWRQPLRQESFYTKCHKEYGESLKAMSQTKG